MKSACVYLNKIVYCGYRDKISTFFVLENNKHDGNLEKAYPEHNMNSDYTSILKTAKYFRSSIYAFSDNTYSRVLRFTLDTREWSLYF